MSTNHAHYIESSHDGVSHDSLTNLGYDWSRIADPGITARPPFKVYLPRSTEDVVRAVHESVRAGDAIVVRGHAHSSNNLVTPDHGVVVLTDQLNRIQHIDTDAMTVTIQGGAPLMMVDLFLAETGLGLSIIGDHDHITAAGFASVGGISPASHRHGMFVDTVQALEYVDWAGKVHRCSRTERADDLLRVLAGTGKHGIITELTVNIIRVDKFRTIMHNRRHVTPSLNDFVRYSGEMIRNPGDAVMERGVWADFEVPLVRGVNIRMGQFSSYHPTRQRLYKSWWNDLAYGLQHRIGYVAGRLPTLLDDLTKYVGMGAIMLSPRYAGMKNIERFTDQILDATVGDPTRMFVVLAPAERYETLFHQLYETVVAERGRSGAITFISVYVKSIRSPYLAGGDPDRRYCEIMLYLGVRPQKMTQRVLDHLVGKIDRLVMANHAFRYLHSLTSEDPQIRDRVDPNAQYRGDAAPAGGRTAGAAGGRTARVAGATNGRNDNARNDNARNDNARNDNARNGNAGNAGNDNAGNDNAGSSGGTRNGSARSGATPGTRKQQPAILTADGGER